MKKIKTEAKNYFLVWCYNCMVIRRGCWPAKMLIIAPRSSGMLYLECRRAKPVRLSSPIVVYIIIYNYRKKFYGPGGGGIQATGNPPGYAPDLLCFNLQHHRYQAYPGARLAISGGAGRTITGARLTIMVLGLLYPVVPARRTIMGLGLPSPMPGSLSMSLPAGLGWPYSQHRVRCQPRHTDRMHEPADRMQVKIYCIPERDTHIYIHTYANSELNRRCLRDYCLAWWYFLLLQYLFQTTLIS